MSTELHFAGVVVSSAGARSWRQRLLRRSLSRIHTQARGCGVLRTQRSATVVHFLHGELDGAEGIDVRRHEEINLINLS